MLHPTQLNKSFSLFILLGSLELPVILNGVMEASAPIFAHEVEVSGNVAATFHLEPNHNPKAGETAQVWFALTQKGGKIVPFSNCQCQLVVYREPRSTKDSPMMTLTLQSVSAEQYQDIPGADVVFPNPGQYQLELTGSPKNGANFNPFQFSYSVIVQ